MCIRPKTLLMCAVLMGFIACGTTAFLFARGTTSNATETGSVTAQGPAQTQRAHKLRNLSSQPDAFRLARRLGARFSSGNRTSVATGTLTIDTETRIMQMTRTHTEDGESVAIDIERSAGPLAWNAKQGVLASGRQVTASERELIERLVLDSPDQFVLMQLRGASYYVVASGVRPVDATDGYSGPLWTIVRVDDPEQDAAKRPGSRWRLYYFNSSTGLLDQVESEVQGQRIIAKISAWTEQDGETFPAQIVWTHEGRILMQYRLTNFS